MQMFFYVLLVAACSYGLAYLCFPMFLTMMFEHKMVKPNYRQEEIPAMVGLFFVVLLPLCYAVQLFLGSFFRLGFFGYEFTIIMMFFYAVVFVGFGLLGIVDDLIGNNDRKGFKGHFKALIVEKRLTSGGMKAVGGAFLALFFVTTANMMHLTSTYNSSHFFLIVMLDFLLLLLATNMMNLFDLRPGRAIKVFLLFFLLIALIGCREYFKLPIFIPVLAMVLFYLPFDLKAQAMLGDAGSNPLGASLGMMMVFILPLYGKISLLLLLLALHASAERYSFTEFIAQNKWLRMIDEWGRDLSPISENAATKTEDSVID